MANEMERLKRIDDDLGGVEDTQNKQSIRQTTINTTTTVKNSTVVLFQLDATGGSISDICCEIYLASDSSATFTISVSKTRSDDLVTFVDEAYPDYIEIVQPSASNRYRVNYGDLFEDQQMKISISQDNNGAATVICDASLKYTED